MRHAAVWLTGLGWMLTGPASAASLFEAFESPDSQAKPWVRWWWPDNRVTAEELIRELDVMSDAGIGGVEIVPIGLGGRPAEGLDAPPQPWLSPEWCRLVRVTTDAAKQRGMQVDMSHSFGWPARGDFLAHEHRAATLFGHQERISGPTLYQMPLHQLPNWRTGRSALKYARLVPQQLNQIDEILTFDDAVDDGTLRIRVPEGQYVLQIGVLVREFHGAMLDHYDREAVQAYHQHLAERMLPHFDGDLGDHFRSFFADSIEVRGSNWTRSLEEQFQRRRGYALRPYISFLPRAYQDRGPYEDLFKATTAVMNEIRKARYDYSLTLVELMHENFIGVFDDWCSRHGVLSRVQVYGWPWHFGIESGYLLPDIPEGNGWLSHNAGHNFAWAAWNKLTASGGHMADRRIISCEAMTTVHEVYEVNLDWIKRADDFNFIQGITHSVLHGFSYSPPEVKYPGVVIFGTFFSDKNPWWPYFPRWSGYNARLSALFQRTRPVVEIAILGPSADAWSRGGLDRGVFHQQAWYAYDHLWRALSNHGVNADFIGQRTLAQADMTNARINVGPMAYKLLVLCDVQTLTPAAATAIETFVTNGGQLAIVGQTPSRVAGLRQDDDVIRETMQRVLRSHAERVQHHESPRDAEHLLTWTGDLLAAHPLHRSIQPATALANVYYIQRRGQEHDVVFISNQSPHQPARIDVQFKDFAGAAYRWDPERGTRERLPNAALSRHTFTLAPSESYLFVTTVEATAETPAAVVTKETTISRQIETPWQVTLTHALGEQSQYTFDKLIDFRHDSRFDTFAGTIEYTTKVNLEQSWEELHVGSIHGVSEVTVNGQPAGLCWYGPDRFNVGEWLVIGENEITVKVTTVLSNYMRQFPQYFRWKSYQERKDRLLPAGMRGPVTLRR